MTDTEIMIRSKNRPSAFAMSHLLVVWLSSLEASLSARLMSSVQTLRQGQYAQAKCPVVFAKIGKYFLRGKFRVNSRKETVPIVSNVQALRFKTFCRKPVPCLQRSRDD